MFTQESGFKLEGVGSKLPPAETSGNPSQEFLNQHWPNLQAAMTSLRLGAEKGLNPEECKQIGEAFNIIRSGLEGMIGTSVFYQIIDKEALQAVLITIGNKAVTFEDPSLNGLKPVEVQTLLPQIEAIFNVMQAKVNEIVPSTPS